VRLVPVQLSVHYSTTRKSNSGYPLEFSPVTPTEITVQPIQNTDSTPDGDRLDMTNLAMNLEVQAASLSAWLPTPNVLPWLHRAS
jgi:hypothetical protein